MRPSRSHPRRLQDLVLLGGLPSLALGAFLLWKAPWPWGWKLALFAPAAFLLFRAQALVRLRAERPLQTLANLLAAIREGDYSFRAREDPEPDALGTVNRELNHLSELLQQQRLRALEAAALLRSVMEELDVAVFAFDEEGRLRLVNRAGELLLRRPVAAMLGMPAGELGLGSVLEGEREGEGESLADLAFPGRAGRFEVRRGQFREGGRPHRLLVLSDLTRSLREEERRTWQKLIRVLGHEINNSLAPIQSLAGSTANLLTRRPEEWEEDALQGLSIIGSRAQALGRFLEAYTRLARLPDPRMTEVEVGRLVRKVAALEGRMTVLVHEGPHTLLKADGDQLEQLLINLVRNAVDAALPSGGAVALSWSEVASGIEIRVEDEGPGLPSGGNLFVPFFTTKPGGSGIGLVLSRQIAEAHGGSLRLEPRQPRGATAVLNLPRQA